MKLKLNPTQKVALILALCSLGAIWVNWSNFSTKLLIHLASTLGFGLTLFYIFKFISKKQKNLWNTVVSCLILFLVLNFAFGTKDIVLALIATFITIFSKFFLEPRGMPIINPVVFGLLVTFLIAKIIPSLYPIFISWWGASYKLSLTSNFIVDLPLILMAIWILWGLPQWRKLPLLISFLIFHAIFILIINMRDPEVWNFFRYSFTTGTIYFFTAIMLIEPKTSPMLKKDQIIFALIAAITYNLLLYVKAPHFDLFAIATANLYLVVYKFIKLKKVTPPSIQTPSSS